jgi:hypothetical protein
MHFILCMHNVKFNIFHHAQLFAHTNEYIVAKQLILILMCVPTKLLYIKQDLCTPCAHYYVCAHCARLNSARASAHNDLLRSATIYRIYWHTNVFSCSAKIYHMCQHANLFHGHFVTPILVTSKLLLCEYSLQLNPSGPSKLSVELKL